MCARGVGLQSGSGNRAQIRAASLPFRDIVIRAVSYHFPWSRQSTRRSAAIQEVHVVLSTLANTMDVVRTRVRRRTYLYGCSMGSVRSLMCSACGESALAGHYYLFDLRNNPFHHIGSKSGCVLNMCIPYSSYRFTFLCGYGLMRFSGQVDGGMSWRGASPQSLRTWLRSAPSTLLSKLMSER